ncbi:MAG: hypothetical protein ACRDMI_11415, partial [Streptosporangiaceae bacterium]
MDRHHGCPVCPPGLDSRREAGGQDSAQMRQLSQRRAAGREPQPERGQAGAGQPAPRRPRSQPAGLGVPG